MGLLDALRREAPGPEGFEVSVTGREEPTFSQIPPDVQEFFWNLVKDPTSVGADSPDETAFTSVQMLTRNDGLQTYVATVLTREDLPLKNPAAVLVDYDPVTHEVVGEALAEDGSKGPLGFAELRVFDTYTKKRGHHLSYPRLTILNRYCFDMLKRTLTSGDMTKHKQANGTRAEEVYAGAEHVWQALMKYLQQKAGQFVIQQAGDRYFFTLHTSDQI